jgi:hypothetical protein
MTMTTARSAYPKPVEDLVPDARALADELGSLPSRNQLKTRLRIGAPKANALLEALVDYSPEPTPAPTAGEPGTTVLPARPEPETTDDDAAIPAPVAEVPQVTPVVDPGAPTLAAAGPEAGAKPRRRLATWPVLLLMLPATVAIWSGWVGLGQLAGFGPVHPLPGIADGFVIDTSITLPIGMETYSAYALYVWLSGRAGAKAIAFARVSALLALSIGAAGQIAYHLMSAAKVPAAHPIITAAVACIPVAVLGLGAALAHLVKEDA